jgi:hypothetical protein
MTEGVVYFPLAGASATRSQMLGAFEDLCSPREMRVDIIIRRTSSPSLFNRRDDIHKKGAIFDAIYPLSNSH